MHICAWENILNTAKCVLVAMKYRHLKTALLGLALTGCTFPQPKDHAFLHGLDVTLVDRMRTTQIIVADKHGFYVATDENKDGVMDTIRLHDVSSGSYLSKFATLEAANSLYHAMKARKPSQPL